MVERRLSSPSGRETEGPLMHRTRHGQPTPCQLSIRAKLGFQHAQHRKRDANSAPVNRPGSTCCGLFFAAGRREFLIDRARYYRSQGSFDGKSLGKNSSPVRSTVTRVGFSRDTSRRSSSTCASSGNRSRSTTTGTMVGRNFGLV